MEESTNTFTGGLNQDLNPIATPDNVLTDAKNATFITFNGNEMSLQNDMGNTKITYTDPLTNVTQSVTLPQGYVPLGVKEYGGILYIVSKNPSTELVEIGSFPSPEFVSDKETPLSVDETKITNDSGVLLGGYSRSESGIFDISTEILHPCDRIKDYSFFPLNFETISTQDERRLFKYKLINNSTRKDITNLSKPFNLSSKVWYKTLLLTKDGVRQDPVTVIFPKGGMYTYPVKGEAYGDKPDEFASYLYEVDDELKLSMYYEGDAGIMYALSEPSPGKKIYPIYDFEYGGDGIYYFPNLQPGTLSFKFYTETIDYFNLHRIEDSVVKYSPELVKDAFQFDDNVIDNIIETFSNTFFTNENGTLTPKLFTSPTGIIDNTILPLPYDSNKYSLQICSDNGETYVLNSDFNRSILDESKRLMTISYTGGEFISLVETNNQQYFLKFDKIKVDQLSWVKVNKVIFSYEIFNNNNPSLIIKKDSKTYNNVKITDGEWDISELSITIPSEEREITLGAFLGKENSTKYLGTGSDGNIALSHFTTVKISNISGAPNYTVKFSFTPYNTDYNIDISQFKIERTIDLTKSPDSWEGNLVFKDNEDVIRVSLDNCLIRENFKYYSLLDLKNNLPIDELGKTYTHYNDIPLSKDRGEVGDYRYVVINTTRDDIINESKILNEYFISDPTNKNITLLNNVDPDLNKYFSWEGVLSPDVGDYAINKGDIAFVNFGRYDDYKTYNILKVGERESKKSILIDSHEMGRIDPPDNINNIISDNGSYDVSNIKRGIKSERDLKHDYTLLALATNIKTAGVINPNKLGYSIIPINIKYEGSKSYLSKYSQLYYIRKNASDTPCDSFGKLLIDPEFIPENAYGFNNIFNGNDPVNLYTSVVPIKSDVLSRAQIQFNVAYRSTFRSPEIFTFSFYLSNNFKGSFICNADVLKIRTDKEIIDNDSILLDDNQYNKYEIIDIESGSKKYTRVVLICKGSSLLEDFYFEFKTITSGGIIYNPVLYNSKLINLSGSSADCVDLRGQGMRLFPPEGSEEYVNRQLGSNKLHANYVPEPFYEIID